MCFYTLKFCIFIRFFGSFINQTCSREEMSHVMGHVIVPETHRLVCSWVLQTRASETRSAPVPASPAPPVPRWSRRRRRTPTARSTGGRRAPATSKRTASLVLRKVTPSPLPSPHTFPAPAPRPRPARPQTGPGSGNAVMWWCETPDLFRRGTDLFILSFRQPLIPSSRLS